ncbi:MAG: HAD hydrolase-like protein [Acidobacteria bacterium]|nr:HAD hydrolase-like protein [Acidobacteriota bacterium]
MLDPDILMRMMANGGVPRRRAQAAMDRICRSAERYYFRHVPDLRRKTCPGVRRLLYRLRRKGAATGLVTGNLTRIGWKKLERASLAQYFQFGIFGEIAPTRTELVRLALRYAQSHGWVNGQTRRVLIGDTPNDIEAARANGVETVAVATGLCSLRELQACSPTLCVRDLTDPVVREWLKAATANAGGRAAIRASAGKGKAPGRLP